MVVVLVAAALVVAALVVAALPPSVHAVVIFPGLTSPLLFHGPPPSITSANVTTRGVATPREVALVALLRPVMAALVVAALRRGRKAGAP